MYAGFWLACLTLKLLSMILIPAIASLRSCLFSPPLGFHSVVLTPSWRPWRGKLCCSRSLPSFLQICFDVFHLVSILRCVSQFLSQQWSQLNPIMHRGPVGSVFPEWKRFGCTFNLKTDLGNNTSKIWRSHLCFILHAPIEIKTVKVHIFIVKLVITCSTWIWFQGTCSNTKLTQSLAQPLVAELHWWPNCLPQQSWPKIWDVWDRSRCQELSLQPFFCFWSNWWFYNDTSPNNESKGICQGLMGSLPLTDQDWFNKCPPNIGWQSNRSNNVMHCDAKISNIQKMHIGSTCVWLFAWAHLSSGWRFVNSSVPPQSLKTWNRHCSDTSLGHQVPLSKLLKNIRSSRSTVKVTHLLNLATITNIYTTFVNRFIMISQIVFNKMNLASNWVQWFTTKSDATRSPPQVPTRRPPQRREAATPWKLSYEPTTYGQPYPPYGITPLTTNPMGLVHIEPTITNLFRPVDTNPDHMDHNQLGSTLLVTTNLCFEQPLWLPTGGGWWPTMCVGTPTLVGPPRRSWWTSRQNCQWNGIVASCYGVAGVVNTSDWGTTLPWPAMSNFQNELV